MNASQAAFWLIPSDAFVGPLAEVGIAAIGSIGMIGAFIGPYAFGLTRDVTGSYSAGLLFVAALDMLASVFVHYSSRSQEGADVAVGPATVY